MVKKVDAIKASVHVHFASRSLKQCSDSLEQNHKVKVEHLLAAAEESILEAKLLLGIIKNVDSKGRPVDAP